jgi:hypothetical protein
MSPDIHNPPSAETRSFGYLQKATLIAAIARMAIDAAPDLI